jgi:N-acetylneuraminate synthase
MSRTAPLKNLVPSKKKDQTVKYPQTVQIGKRAIGFGQSVFIVAEAGVNHNGSEEIAKQMIHEAKTAGADAIKFQTFIPEKLASKSAQKATYQLETTDPEESQLEMLKKLALPEKTFENLFKLSQKIEITFLSAPFDEESAEFLFDLGVEVFKIPSGEIDNIPLLRQIADYSRPVIISTGMSCLSEVEKAWKIFYDNEVPTILLHCTSNYPCLYEDVNLRAIDTLREGFNCPVGYSDHTEGMVIPIAAIARNCALLEKHFTLEKSMSGPDHKASMEPEEFRAMITHLRTVEIALGNGVKVPSPREFAVQRVVRKRLVAAMNIKAQQVIHPNMLTAKRPANGISPSYFDLVVGRKAIKNIAKDEPILWNHI